MFQPFDLLLHGGIFRFDPLQTSVAHQPHPVAVNRHPPVGVVLPVNQAVFRPGGHHPVGLVGPLCHQIVNEYPCVSVPPGQDQRRLALDLQRGVDPRHQPLGGGFLVAGGAVELSRAVQARHFFALQRGQQLSGVHAVIFDGIGAPGHFRVLQARNGVKHFHLHFFRQGGGEPLNIQLLGIHPHGLDKELVPGLLGKAHHLILNGRAVARPHPLNDPGEQGGAVEVVPNDLVGGLIGVGQVAHRPVFRRRLRGKGERDGHVVPRLNLHFGKVHAPAVHPWGRARFKASDGQAQAHQTLSQRQSRRHAVRAGRPRDFAHNGAAPQVGPGGGHRRFDGVGGARHSPNTAHSAVFRQDFRHFRLLDPQVFLQLQGVLHDLLIAAAVCLGPEGPDRRALAPVEHTVLDAGFIGGAGHFAAQGVDFADQVALAGAADGRIAGHIAHRVQVDGEADCSQAHTG